MKFGLTTMRVEKGLSIGEVAEAIGISATHLATYERSPWIMPTDVLEKLACYYEASPFQLVNDIAEFDWAMRKK